MLTRRSLLIGAGVVALAGGAIGFAATRWADNGYRHLGRNLDFAARVQVTDLGPTTLLTIDGVNTIR